KVPVTPKEWAEARASQMFKAWESAERMSPAEAASVSLIDVYSLFPETFSCDRNNFERLGGDDDGAKWTCGEYFQPAPGNCTAVSLGSNGQWQFEESILEHTNSDCIVYTFDCTGTWIPPHNNIRFFPWCLGEDKIIDGRVYKTWDSITRDLGLTHVDYFKMDIEGFEWLALPPALDNLAQGGVLPKQIALEMHLWPQAEGVAKPYQATSTKKGLDFVHPMINLFRKFYSLGYHIGAVEYNHLSSPYGCCQEFTFILP
ncbi:hypothetical protein HDU99_003045, partial [Rhizoclosmatium hyalinum]